MIGGRRCAAFVGLVSLAVWSSPGDAQPYYYPMRGQSPQQEESDKGQCYGWAVQQTGFDPANPRVAMPAPPPSSYGQPQAPQGGMVRAAGKCYRAARYRRHDRYRPDRA